MPDDRGVDFAAALLPAFLRHVDDHLVVAVKPSGLPAVPGRAEGLQECLATRVQALVPDALVVHRLDMATSGLMLFGPRIAPHRPHGPRFAEREVGKSYVAVVAGRPERDEGEIDLPLSADWPARPRQKVDREHGKPSLTRYRVLDHDAAAGTSRLELTPVTGRSHQLRLHLLAIGHPILGDALYAPPAVLALAPRLLLHAQALQFRHPESGAALRFVDPAPF